MKRGRCVEDVIECLCELALHASSVCEGWFSSLDGGIGGTHEGVGLELPVFVGRRCNGICFFWDDLALSDEAVEAGRGGNVKVSQYDQRDTCREPLALSNELCGVDSHHWRAPKSARHVIRGDGDLITTLFQEELAPDSCVSSTE